MSAINQNSATPPALQVQPNPNVIVQRMGDEVVLVHLQTNRIYELNRTAARLWELLSAGDDWAEVQRIMLQEFDVTEAQLAGESEDLLTSLKNEHLISP